MKDGHRYWIAALFALALIGGITSPARATEQEPEKRTPAEEQLARGLYAGEFGFREILVIRRDHLALSHVYTYHVEGYRPGGGLYVYLLGPDGGIAFISDRKPAYAYCFVTTSPVLYRTDRDGSNQRRLSANYLMDFTPAVLNDGRVIYTRSSVRRPAGLPDPEPVDDQPGRDGTVGVLRQPCDQPRDLHASPADIPQTFYTRMLQPEKNGFLLAPLAKSAGGTEACGLPIFRSKDDPDYRRIVETFRPIQELLRQKPRADMDGFVQPPCNVPVLPKRIAHAENSPEQ